MWLVSSLQNRGFDSLAMQVLGLDEKLVIPSVRTRLLSLSCSLFCSTTAASCKPRIKMIPSLLFPAFATLAAAETLPLSDFESAPGSLKPRSLGPRNVFNRQSAFSCSSGSSCYDTQTCCGTSCCDAGYTYSSTFRCDSANSTEVSPLHPVPCPIQEAFG